MKTWQKIVGLITFITILIFGVLTWINAYVDAKYIIEPFNIDLIEERYYVYRWFAHSDVDNLLFIPCPVHYSLAERR